MTIFLTTQYLEEADVLAGRVGIIARGRIVAEGTPADLKRSIGSDVILVRVDAADAVRAAGALDGIAGVEHVEARGDTVVVGASNGGASLSPVAVALSGAGVAVHELTLRTPTLDDVFLEMTGERMKEQEESA